MPRWLHALLQCICVFVQGLNAGGVFDHNPIFKVVVASLVSAIQLYMGLMAQSFNPDGTPAQVPYVKDK